MPGVVENNSSGGREGDVECSLIFETTVSNNKMEAFIRPRGDSVSGVLPEDVMEMLEFEGIRYGIVGETAVAEYLAAGPDRKTPWKIAQGAPPEPGRPGEVKYHFDTRPPRVGTIDELGFIDYKDRGEIPQVRAGDVVAEIDPGSEGTPGTDVGGNVVESPKEGAIRLNIGPSIKKSKDGLRFYAKVDGRPVLNDDGMLNIAHELQIDGDVGIETGHIDYNGPIEVLGTVRQGFRVKGKSLVAREILKAEIELEEDIVVLEGIVGANIRVGGNMKAGYLRSTKIDAGGDVVVMTEVIDTVLAAGGTCKIEHKKVLSSDIEARMGITAVEIGSRATRPCKLTVGINKDLEREVKRILERIAEKKRRQKTLQEEITSLENRASVVDEAINKSKQEINGIKVQNKKLLEGIEGPHRQVDEKKILIAKKAVLFLNEKSNQCIKEFKALVEEQKRVSEKIVGHKEEIKKLEYEVLKMSKEVIQVSEKSVIKEGVFSRYPVVRVFGTIHAETEICGPNASLCISEDQKRVEIRERRGVDKSNPDKWTMESSGFR